MRRSRTDARPPRSVPLLVPVLVAVLGLAALVVALRDHGYRLDVVMSSAVGITPGQPVRIEGREAGEVLDVVARDGAAVVTVGLTEPVRSGAVVRVEWRSLLGERALGITPGPADGPELPSGSTIPAGADQVTVEDLLETLDEPTRLALAGTLRELSGTLADRDLNRTVASAGPAVQALGAVLAAVGEDGPAVRALVVEARELTSVLVARQDRLASTVTDLADLTETVAAQQRALTDGLGRLPGTLTSATAALDAVPSATDAAVPLLEGLAPATARLPGLAAQLRPALADLRPVAARLRPVLAATDDLLDRGPRLLDATASTLPQVTDAVDASRPAAAFLRPYTPEVAGVISNWGNMFAAYDAEGHYAQALITFGLTSFDDLPPQAPTGGVVDTTPAPGAAGGQPWEGPR